MVRPRLLDLFCGAGGCAVGYHRAGFDVTGVDIKPQPRFPFPFVQADALEYLRDHGREFDAIHASPPCQRFSTLNAVWKADHPDLLNPTRDLLLSLRLPYVIENVVGAPLRGIMLCGTMFGLKIYRHRLFECSNWLWEPEHPKHKEVIGAHCRVTDSGGKSRQKVNANGWASVTGGIGDVATARLAMGIDWMVEDELTQAIPPAYTEYVGLQLYDLIR